MNTRIKKLVQYTAIAVIVALSGPVTLGDDLNPPDYRGDPLSVHAHWNVIPGTPFLELTDFSWQDDADPGTTLHPLRPPDPVEPTGDKDYQFDLPNWIDEMPVKYMRLQLTWMFIPDEPTIDISGVDGIDPVPGNIVFTSPVENVAPETYYQYYDIEFYPNPDVERWTVFLPDSAELVQTVADTVSTIPEPATLSVLGLGSLVLLRRRK